MFSPLRRRRDNADGQRRKRRSSLEFEREKQIRYSQYVNVDNVRKVQPSVLLLVLFHLIFTTRWKDSALSS